MSDLNIQMILKLVDQVTGPARAALRSLDQIKKAGGDIAAGGRRVLDGAKNVGAAATAYGAAAALVASQMLAPARQNQRIQTILETTEGSSEKAKEAMAWVENFAVKTPYELDQVMAAFVQLRAYGLDPTTGLLETLGDTSAAMGTDVMQAVEAIADAVMGQNERLLAFGIRARKEGEYFIYEYTQDGIAKTAKALATDRAAIEQTLTGILDGNFEGAMEKLASTFDGILNNILDMWNKFQRMIMSAGLFDWMKDKLSGVLDTLNQLAEDGSLDEWAQEISDSIVETLNIMWELGSGAAAAFAYLGEWLAWAADKLGGWNELAAVLIALPLASSLANIAIGLALVAKGAAALVIASGPIGWIIAGIAAGAYLIYQNWAGIVAYFEEKFARITAAFRDGFLAGMVRLFVEVNPFVMIVEAVSGIDLYENGVAIVESLWAGIRSSINEMVAWVVAKLEGMLPDWVREFVTSTEVSEGSSSRRESRRGGNRALGGPTRAGFMYRINEEGQEFFMPDVAGRVISSRDIRSGGQAATTGGPSIQIGELVVNGAPGQDPQALARAVRRELEQMMRQRSALHDGGLYK